MDASEVESSYMMRLSVADAVGVLARVSDIFAKHNISIRAVQQRPEEDENGNHELWITTHNVADRVIRETAEEVSNAKSIGSVLSIMRVFED